MGDPHHSGQYVQSLNSAAITWSLAKQLYGPHGPYIWVPLSLLFGMVPTVLQWFVAKVRAGAVAQVLSAEC